MALRAISAALGNETRLLAVRGSSAAGPRVVEKRPRKEAEKTSGEPTLDRKRLGAHPACANHMGERLLRKKCAWSYGSSRQTAFLSVSGKQRVRCSSIGLHARKKVEAAGGFEPPYNGFADRRLTTWLSRPFFQRHCMDIPVLCQAGKVPRTARESRLRVKRT